MINKDIKNITKNLWRHIYLTFICYAGTCWLSSYYFWFWASGRLNVWYNKDKQNFLFCNFFRNYFLQEKKPRRSGGITRIQFLFLVYAVGRETL